VSGVAPARACGLLADLFMRRREPQPPAPLPTRQADAVPAPVAVGHLSIP
jgi:hypothetical protein